MIKAQSIIQQLQSVLPDYTDLFTDNVGITSVTRVDTTVTVITDEPHGINTNNFVFIQNVKTPISVESITRIDNIATVVLNSDHDFTEGFDMTTEIVGCDQAEYNGTKTILKVPNRRTFTFEVSGEPVTPATGSIKALNVLNRGYNGRHEVTKIDATSFSYQISQTPESPAFGSAKMKKRIRVSGAADLDRAADSYTKHGNNELWAFVVLGDTAVSKDRHVRSDATAVFAAGDDFRQSAISSFSIVVIAPTTNEISGRAARDLMEDVGVALFRSILRSKIPNVLACPTQYSTVFTGSRSVNFTGAYLVHEFGFETMVDITYDDTVNADYNVAFRDIHIDFYDDKIEDGDDIIMEIDVDLDDVPL